MCCRPPRLVPQWPGALLTRAWHLALVYIRAASLLALMPHNNTGRFDFAPHSPRCPPCLVRLSSQFLSPTSLQFLCPCLCYPEPTLGSYDPAPSDWAQMLNTPSMLCSPLPPALPLLPCTTTAPQLHQRLSRTPHAACNTLRPACTARAAAQPLPGQSTRVKQTKPNQVLPTCTAGPAERPGHPPPRAAVPAQRACRGRTHPPVTVRRAGSR